MPQWEPYTNELWVHSGKKACIYERCPCLYVYGLTFLCYCAALIIRDKMQALTNHDFVEVTHICQSWYHRVCSESYSWWRLCYNLGSGSSQDE